mmetsp:Transcript_6058/g.27151  ORF Transcript_6058/g.27151 Transcript_6058/m.27151 type:complete len:320 (+) Transcript_6058:842-1801(+)
MRCSLFFLPLCSTSLVNSPFLSLSRSAGSPNSAMVPLSRNATLSESMMVFSLCAMVRTVQSANASRTVRWMSASLSMSTLAVASSIMSTLLLRSRARPMHRSCLWPSEKLAPLSTTSMSIFLAASSTMLLRPTLARTSQRATSGCSSNGSRLVRMVPANMNGSWGIIAILERSRCSPSVLASTPSMAIVPDAGSTTRKSATKREDFPLPVRPHTPSFSPAIAVNVRSLSTKGKPGRYLMFRPVTSSLPFCGHAVGSAARTFGAVSWSDSKGLSRYSTTLSTAFILVSSSLAMLVPCSRYLVTSSAYTRHKPATPGPTLP